VHFAVISEVSRDNHQASRVGTQSLAKTNMDDELKVPAYGPSDYKIKMTDCMYPGPGVSKHTIILNMWILCVSSTMEMRSKHGGQSVTNTRTWEFLCDALAKLGNKRVMALGESKRRKDGGHVGLLCWPK
jgi:hypothetical protein